MSIGAGALALSLMVLGGCESNGEPTATTAQNPPAQNSAPQPTTALAGNPTADQATAPVTRRLDPAQPGANDPAALIAKPPPIAFEPPSLEFGIMKPGEKRTGTIQIRNLSDGPLRIAGSRSSCKCTAVDLANVVIPPGETVPLTASMEPDTSPGPKKAQVRVVIDGYGEIAVVDINAEVALAVRCDPAYLRATEVLSGTFEVSSLEGETFRIIGSDRGEPDFVDFNPATDAPRNSYTLKWDLTKYDPNNCDEWPGWWVVETDHPDAPTVDLRIRHICTIPKKPGTRRWFPKSQRALLGTLGPGESADIDVDMLWAPSATEQDRQDHVIVAASRSKDFTVELLGTDYTLEDPNFELRVTPREDLRGLLYGVFELHSLHGHMAEYVVIGRVEEDAVAADHQ